MRSPILPFCLIGLFIAGCTTRTDIPSTWIGASAAVLTQRWGEPSAKLVNERDNTVLVYDYRISDAPDRVYEYDENRPSRSWYRGRQLPRDRDDLDGTCVVFFELDGETIRAWEWTGNACKALVRAEKAAP